MNKLHIAIDFFNRFFFDDLFLDFINFAKDLVVLFCQFLYEPRYYIEGLGFTSYLEISIFFYVYSKFLIEISLFLVNFFEQVFLSRKTQIQVTHKRFLIVMHRLLTTFTIVRFIIINESELLQIYYSETQFWIWKFFISGLYLI